ncbi:MAG: hypothetical protein JO116_05460 [Planctomycetaceae bacterium]|nr:hypothetical protein [Planctomycetaceae bacterium]
MVTNLCYRRDYVTAEDNGRKGPQAAWKLQFPKVVILLCLSHPGLKGRDRSAHLRDLFAEASRRT